MTEAGQSGDSKEAVAQPKEGSLSAQFTRLYRQYVTPIYSYVYSRVGNRADAEDLTGVVFTEALEGLARYEEQGKEAAWLFTIAHRRIVDHYRSRRDELPLDAALDSPLDNPGPEAAVAQGERLAKLARLVAALDDDKRELLQLRFVAGLSYAEIGAVVGSSEGAVKIAIYRLLDQLRARWPVAGLIGHGNQEVTKDE
jgi:RNA polymerase sigma factor (sigma-70 family)